MSRQCTHYGRWPQHGFTSLKKLRPQSVTSRIQPGSDVHILRGNGRAGVGAALGLNHVSAGYFTPMTGCAGRWWHTSLVSVLWPALLGASSGAVGL
ncbi:hypothetical protein ACNKHQ_17265 [Shigella flexneri]